jgi:hypothetical protein
LLLDYLAFIALLSLNNHRELTLSSLLPFKVGLLIGPRGNTLKKMETESGAKIAIRGKGSVKEGKGRSDAAHASNQEEDLHCLIMADTEEKVNKAKKLVHNVIETAASIPEGQNELKRNQLRELAALNGTLRDDENQACQNCGQIGHRKYDCPEQRNFTANIICRVCGNAGHMARDCPDRQRGSDWRNGGSYGGGRRAIGQGDAVDREMEVSSMSFLYSRTTNANCHSNLCKNCPAVLQVRTASLLAGSRPVPITVTMIVTRSHGSADLLPAMWLPGSREGGTTALATTTDPAIRAVHLRGRHRAVAAIMDTDRMQVATAPLVLPLLLVALLLGSSKLRLHHPAEQVLMDMGLIPVTAQLCLVWAPRVLLPV